MDFFKFLSTTDLFRGIKEDDIRKLTGYLGYKNKQYDKNETIFGTGGKVSKTGILLSGSVNMIINHPWGASSLFGRKSAGGVIGGMYPGATERPLVFDIVAAENCEVMFFDTDKMLTVTENSPACHADMLRNLVSIAAETCMNQAVRMIHIAPKPLRHRLMSYLEEQALINGSRKFRIPLTHKQLAEYLNVNRSAMSYELSRMREEGLINYHKFDFEIFFGNR
ncbi:MAG: Crp/Fnr family transcriptional regulator [Abditibacteriota bacterium]|nr:Crp/Fnr family transcriptional regulator [Abditibacteriota bacterium]